MIVVTGMHRSGTSMTASLLAGLGADFGAPGDMIAADQWNQSGYFESKEAVGINLRLLLGTGVNVENWIHPPARPSARLVNVFTSGKWRYLLPATSAMVRRRADALSADMAEFGRRSAGLFVKDPRFAVTYRYWRERAAIEAAVFCFRHPEAVCRSIAKRDLMPRSVAMRMWLQHNRDFALSLSGDEPVVLVDYDRFFSPEAGDRIARLARFVSAATGKPGNASAAASMIDLKQRHHRTADLPIGNGRARAVYEALARVSAGESEPVPAGRLRERLEKAGLR